ncbi:unnamed protein product [Adineta ricciae]|uniref:Uncharacterized protein n=1 Tax=Adineta ricciae TaxID=249248 RepID=A0A815MN00_ADIRI|nr:unnamed protein product [Adineta ricciae]
MDSRPRSTFSSVVTATSQMPSLTNFKAAACLESNAVALSRRQVANVAGYTTQRTLSIHHIMDFTTIKTISDDQTTTYVDQAGLING